jgi:hypothetical protein
MEENVDNVNEEGSVVELGHLNVTGPSCLNGRLQCY